VETRLAVRLPAAIERLGAAFERAQKPIFLVGGSVRDALLGREQTDYDFTTAALPAEVRRTIAPLRPAAVFDVGEKFGTIGLVLDGLKIEITTFRAEWYPNGTRKPEVRFGSSLEEDLARRDFTINAIAQRLPGGEVIDPFHGLSDLRDGLIRAVGDPDARLAEDPLRLLRAIRFAVQLGFRIDPETWEACARNAAALQRISRERIAEEMNRILLSARPGQGLRALTELGLMRYIIPEFLAMRGMPDAGRGYKDLYEHTVQVVDNAIPDLVVRWAALLHDIAKPVTLAWENGQAHFKGHEVVGERMTRAILADLRQPAPVITAVAKLVRLHLRANQYGPEWTDGAVRRFIRECGDQLEALLALSRADITSRRPAKVEAARARVAELEARCRDLIAREDVVKLASPLDGNELMALFNRPPGRWIAPVKDYLLGLVLEGELAPDDKATAERLARTFLANRDESEGGAGAGR
jgi:poly(A) polymerase